MNLSSVTSWSAAQSLSSHHFLSYLDLPWSSVGVSGLLTSSHCEETIIFCYSDSKTTNTSFFQPLVPEDQLEARLWFTLLV